MAAALSAADPSRPADRLVAAAAAVLVVVGAGRGRRRRLGPDPWHVLLFLIGAIVMRGAGCTWNDLVDRDIDARVERTRSRPIPSGQVSVRAAVVFLVVQALVGLAGAGAVQRALPIVVGIASLAVVAIYPFMKRVTYWPQIFLGLAFSWGALMGWAAARGGWSCRRCCSTPARSPG